MKPEAKKRILLVDDDEDILESLRELLEADNYVVRLASNGSEALQILRSGEPLPAAILLDLMMPTMDGFQFRKEQQLDPILKNIPVIIMSADGNSENKLKFSSAFDYLKKPIHIDTLLDTVSAALTNSF